MDLKRILEALLFVADTPLGIPRLANLVDTGDRTAVRQALVELMGEYQERDSSFEVVEVAGGYSFRTKPEYAQWVQKLGKQQVSRLSQAALETLAAIAYKQPVLRAEVERIRGVDVGGVLRMLMEKGLIQVVGRQDLPGKPLIYGTTKRFLEVFGLNSIRDLPTMEEMEALMGDMAEAGEAGEDVTQIGDGKLPLVPSGSSARRTEAGSEFEDGEDVGPDSGDEFEEEDGPESGDYAVSGDGQDSEVLAEDAPGPEREENPEEDRESSANAESEDASDPEGEPEQPRTGAEYPGEAGPGEPRLDDPVAGLEAESVPPEPAQEGGAGGEQEPVAAPAADGPRDDPDRGEDRPEPDVVLVAVPDGAGLDDEPSWPGADPAAAEEVVEEEQAGDTGEPTGPVVSLGVSLGEPPAKRIATEPAQEPHKQPAGGDAAPKGADQPEGKDNEAAEDAEIETPKPGRVSVGFTVDGADGAGGAGDGHSREEPEPADGGSSERKD